MKSFIEIQRFSNPRVRAFIWLAILGSLASIVVAVFFSSYLELSSDNQIGILMTSITFLLISLLFLSSKLVTKVDQYGIHIQYIPILWKWRKYAWQDIKNITIRDCRPIFEYGGWGYRIGIFGQGNAAILNGKTGVQLEFKNGKKMFIGTNDKEKIQNAIELYSSYNFTFQNTQS